MTDEEWGQLCEIVKKTDTQIVIKDTSAFCHVNHWHRGRKYRGREMKKLVKKGFTS